MYTSTVSKIRPQYFLIATVVASACVFLECGATELFIPNQSFESPVLSDGGAIFSVPGWAGQGTTAIQNPANSYFNNTSDGSTNSTLHGLNACAVNSGGKLSYQMTNVLAPQVIYSMTYLAGFRIGVPFGAGSSISLWAGNNLLVERLPSPPEGTFAPYSLSYTSAPSGPFLGLPLRIELKATGANSQPWFDNVRLFSNPSFCTPHKATAIAQLVNGIFVGGTITDPGCGYTNVPTVTIQGGGGNGAIATAIMATNGTVAGLQVNAGGCCYTSLPTIVFSSPPFVPTVAIRVNTVLVTQNVEIGHKYVLESSLDLVTWMATGPAFTATMETVENVFDVSQTGRYFRLREVP